MLLIGLPHDRIDDTDHLVLYAPSGHTGETVFILPEAPQIDFNGATNVQTSWENGSLRLNYRLNGSSFVDIITRKGLLRVVILDKDVANTWHAPVIPGTSNFPQFFSIGTNET